MSVRGPAAFPAPSMPLTVKLHASAQLVACRCSNRSLGAQRVQVGTLHHTAWAPSKGVFTGCPELVNHRTAMRLSYVQDVPTRPYAASARWLSKEIIVAPRRTRSAPAGDPASARLVLSLLEGVLYCTVAWQRQEGRLNCAVQYLYAQRYRIVPPPRSNSAVLCGSNNRSLITALPVRRGSSHVPHPESPFPG